MAAKSPLQSNRPEIRFWPYTIGITCPYELVCTRSAFSKLGFAASAFFPPPFPPDIKPMSLRSKPAKEIYI